MTRPVALITGSSGLVGSEMVAFFESSGYACHGVDNNLRRDFFGRDGDTTWNLRRLQREAEHFTHHSFDIRDRDRVLEFVELLAPAVIVHCAAQPSHDLAASRPYDDFDVNAVGTLNLLEAARRHCGESPFVFLSTNKVYGDAPNEMPLRELETRWDYAEESDWHGVDESCRIDATLHSLFGVSKLAADVLVQEYGRYFDMPTVCFRGGCLTGSNHSGAELHGFLAYLARAVRDGLPYRIYGHLGKQVRDNLHAFDVCTAAAAFVDRPTPGAVYNLGGGRWNSVSMMEAIERFEGMFGRNLEVEYVAAPRTGDHICYITDTRKFAAAYPDWQISRSLDDIFEDFAHASEASGAGV